MKKEQEGKAMFLPAEIYNRLEERVKSSGFGSVDEYVIFILEEVLKEDGEQEQRAYSEEEEAEVKKRLKALGYLD
jgi:Arc/MetJ-type ribon-helix-helix transcriptional regulator